MPPIFSKKKLLLIFALALSAYTNADLITLEKQKTEDSLGIEEKEALALLGESEDQLEIASIYYYGKNGIKKDLKKAFDWYEIAASSNNSKAQNTLGVFYIKGEIIDKDANKALEYFKKSALNGNSSAQTNLGEMYLGKMGVEKNYEQAFYWFKKASDQDNHIAPFYIAHMYQLGLGREKDTAQAKKWYEISSNRGYQIAKEKLSIISINESDPNNEDLLKEEKEQYNQKVKKYNVINISKNSNSDTKYIVKKEKVNLPTVNSQSKQTNSKKPQPTKNYSSKNSATQNSMKETSQQKNQPKKSLVGIDRFSKLN